FVNSSVWLCRLLETCTKRCTSKHFLDLHVIAIKALYITNTWERCWTMKVFIFKASLLIERIWSVCCLAWFWIFSSLEVCFLVLELFLSFLESSLTEHCSFMLISKTLQVLLCLLIAWVRSFNISNTWEW